MKHHIKNHSIFSTKVSHLAVLAIVTTLTLFSITGCHVANSQTPETATVSATTQVSDEFSSFIGATTGISGVESTLTSTDFPFDWRQLEYTTLTLDGDSIVSSGQHVTVNGSVATITASGVYEVTGNLTDGSIVVEVDKSQDKDPVILVLNGADITSKDSAPINVKSAKKVVLLLEESTENSLADTPLLSPDENSEPRSTIFSKDDLTITGHGTLIINANYNDAVNGRDDVYITGGNLIINAVSDGIVGKDSVQISGGSFNITAEKDGIRSTNDSDETKGNILIFDGQFTINASADAIQAENTLYIADGIYHLVSGGGYPGQSTSTGNDNRRFGTRTEGFRTGEMPFETDVPATNSEITEAGDETTSQKGLKAGVNLVIDGGTYDISSYDDAVHSDDQLTINAGTLKIETGDDAIRSENQLIINGGDITVSNAYEGIESAEITINGGNIYINADDDGINVNSSGGLLTINGGDIYVIGRGDGIDSNGDILMLNGSLRVDGLSMGMEGAIDYDGTFKVEGGELISLGSATLTRISESDFSQPMIYMQFTSTQPAGTFVSLHDHLGNELLSHVSTMSASYALFTSPALSIGNEYTIMSDGISLVSVTLESTITYLSEEGITSAPQNMMPGGGRQRGGSPTSPQTQTDGETFNTPPTALPEGLNLERPTPPEGFDGQQPTPPEGFDGQRPVRQGGFDGQQPARPESFQ